jgi:hypothetical protein
VRIAGRGHPSIRATHAKTLEFSADATITERATCVIAVRSRIDQPVPLTGPVRITISVGSHSFGFLARANGGFAPGGSAVVRRSPLQLPGTLATRADAAASDLPPGLVSELRNPSAEVVAEIERVDGPPTAVLFALDPHRPDNPRLAPELAAADVVVAEDETAARLLGERVTAGPVEVSGRVLVVACDDLPGATVVGALRRVEIETVGLPGRLAAAAASPSRGPLLVAPDGADPRPLLRRTSAATRLVVTTRAEAVPDLLRYAAEIRGSSAAVVVAEYAPPQRVDADSELLGKGPVHVCLDAAVEGTALDPTVRAVVDSLLADGTPTKSVANALAILTGWDRRRAYDAVLDWPRAAPGRPAPR